MPNNWWKIGHSFPGMSKRQFPVKGAAGNYREICVFTQKIQWFVTGRVWSQPKKNIMRAFNEALIVQQAIPGRNSKTTNVLINGIMKLQSSKTKTKNTNGNKTSLKVLFWNVAEAQVNVRLPRQSFSTQKQCLIWFFALLNFWMEDMPIT